MFSPTTGNYRGSLFSSSEPARTHLSLPYSLTVILAWSSQNWDDSGVLGKPFLTEVNRRQRVTRPQSALLVIYENQSELESLGSRWWGYGLQGYPWRCARQVCKTGGIYSHPKLFSSCFHTINLPAVAVGVGRVGESREQTKRVIRRKTRPG